MKSTCEQYHKEENQKREKRGREEHIEANMPQCTIYSIFFLNSSVLDSSQRKSNWLFC